MNLLLALFAFVVPFGDHRQENPKAPEAAAEWVAVSPRALAPELERLAEHRTAQGLASAALVSVEAIAEAFPAESRTESVRAFVESAVARGKTRFVLFVGDANAIPPASDPVPDVPGLHPGRCFNDSTLARDSQGRALPVSIGRWATNDAGVVKRLVDRTIEYEKDERPAGWRRRVTFLAADGGFGGAIDAALETAVSGLFEQELPSALELRVLRAGAPSPFSVDREHEKEALLEHWSVGSLISIYAGHGSRFGFHTATGTGRTRPILSAGDLRSLSIRAGAPLLLLFACETTEQVDAGGPGNSARGCIAESFLEAPRGAIAVLGAAQISHPYADLILSHEMNALFREDPTRPIGDLVRKAKEKVVTGSDAFRTAVDRGAVLFGLTDEHRQALVRYEGALYQLLGDPAVRLRAPSLDAAVKVDGVAKPGSDLAVEVAVNAPDGASVLLTLEIPRSAPPRFESFPASNVRTIARAVGAIAGGRWRGVVAVPNDPGVSRLVLVADVRALGFQSIGSAVVPIAAPVAAPAEKTGAR